MHKRAAGTENRFSFRNGGHARENGKSNRKRKDRSRESVAAADHRNDRYDRDDKYGTALYFFTEESENCGTHVISARRG